MAATMDEARAYFEWMGADVEATIYFEVTDWGAPPTRDYVYGGDPGWPPEWEIHSISLREDRPGGLGPEFETTGALFDVLSQSERIHDAIHDAVAEDEMNRHCSRLRRYAR